MDGGGLMGWMIDAAAIGVAVVIVLAAVRLGSLQYTLLAPHDAEGVPLLHSLGFASGLAAAVALVLAAPHAVEFSLHRIFAEDSSWNVTLGEFLARHALPGLGTLGGAGAGLIGAGGAARAAAAWLAVLATMAGLLVCLRSWRGRARWRAAMSFVLLAAWTALIAHYAIHLAAWGLMQLGFWAFLLLLLALQHWRYRLRGRAAHG